MSRFMSARFASVEEYVPGEQPRDMRYLKLNTNESPYPPTERTSELLRGEAGRLNLYSDPDCTELTRALAKRYGVSTENVFIGNGSDEVLNFAFMGFCDGERPVAFPDVTYGFFEVYANLYGLSYKKIPVADDLSIRASDYYGIGMNVVIANPNAMTGLTVTLAEIEEILRTNPDHVVLVDEAYVDFGGDSAVPLTKKYENLLVSQTYSKSRSMAGARLGFAIGSRELISDLNKIKFSTNPYNINRQTQLAGLTALEEDGYYMSNCEKIKATREHFRRELLGRGFEVTASSANFVLARTPELPGAELYSRLKAEGILVRHFRGSRVEDWVRITIGTPEQMDTLLAAIDKLLKERRA